MGTTLEGGHIIYGGAASLLRPTCYVHQAILGDLCLVALFQCTGRGWVNGDGLGRATRIPRRVHYSSYWLLDKFNIFGLDAVTVGEVS